MKKLKLRTKPFPHQLKATRRALKQGSHCFFFEPRCGKSKAALDSLAVQYHRGVVQRVVVIAPLIALDVWVGQIQQHLAVPAKVKVVGERAFTYYPYYSRHKKSKGLDRRHLHKPLQIFLINYDKFSRRGKDEAYRNAYLNQVERWEPDLLILDESHRVKSSGAVRSQALWRMVRRLRARRDGGLPFIYLLTGTPNPKGYIDLFSQYRILDESIFGTARGDFEERYCTFGRDKLKYTVVKYRRKKEILRKAGKVSTIITAKQAGLDGKQFFNPLHVILPQKVMNAYGQLAEEFLTEINGQVLSASNAGVRRMRLLQLTGGFTTDGTKIHSVKLAATKDWLTDLHEQREHVVVYARFLPEVAALERLCGQIGFVTRAISGSVKPRDRTEAIRGFQRSDRPSAIVFQVEAGSMSIELTAAAEAFFYSLPDNWVSFYGDLERLRGPNQHRPVRYTYLLARGTVDMRVLETLRLKRDMHKEMMKSPRSFLFGL